MARNVIQNIFMDLKTYERLKAHVSVEELNAFLLQMVDVKNVRPIHFCMERVVVEYYPKNTNLGFIYTVNDFHTLAPSECKFRNSIYVYSREAMQEYEDEQFSGVTLLLYTTKETLDVIPYGENCVIRMKCRGDGVPCKEVETVQTEAVAAED